MTLKAVLNISKYLDLLQFLSWDSQCFGYKVGEITTSYTNFKQAIAQAIEEKYDLLYLRAKPEDTQMNVLAQNFQGVLADEKITFIKKISEENAYKSQATLYQSDVLDPQILALALQSGEFSRFSMDKNFQKGEYEKLYTAWIKKSLSKEIAKEIIVYERDNKTVGLLTIHQEEQKACIGLLAVEKAYQNQGIGKELLVKASEIAHLWNTSHLQVISQKMNSKAVIFYEKAGFQVEKIENIYHFWLSKFL